MSLPFGLPVSEPLRKEKQKYCLRHKKIQEKKFVFLKEEAKSIENNQRMYVLKQIFSQSPMFCMLNSTLFAIRKSTRKQILYGSWK